MNGCKYLEGLKVFLCNIQYLLLLKRLHGLMDRALFQISLDTPAAKKLLKILKGLKKTAFLNTI